MFYSQFILAKKGPLGTIWIAAHLERKLRKNQVADTDIGVSVDSILFPDVPIALRLSSHLLLGVVRIYSRKVNYLFDDCSEALLKIKQAFRSTAVDLPPEESTAPYHSITLPETFDLDDFELPDSDILQGNYVDHHVSTREQITLQDNMEGVVYSTSQFGLDERFGDGDTSGLDLDEELFLNKVTAPEHTGVILASDAEPHAPVESITPLEENKYHEGINGNLEVTVASGSVNQLDGFDGDTDFIEYAQAPCTPGLLEEPNLSKTQEASVCDDHLDLGEDPNLSNIQETSACDDHPESEDHNITDFTTKENLTNVTSNSDLHCGKENAVSLSLQNDINPVEILGVQELNQLKSPGDSPSTVGGHLLAEPTKAISPPTEIPDRNFTAVDGSDGLQYSLDGVASNQEPGTHSFDGAHAEYILEINQVSHSPEISNHVDNDGNMEKSCFPSAPNIEFSDRQYLENPETQACQDPKDSEIFNPVVHEKLAAADMHVLQPCKHLNQSGTFNHECDVSVGPHLPSGVIGQCLMETSERSELPHSPVASVGVQGESHNTTDFIKLVLEENHSTEPASCEDIQADLSKLNINVIESDNRLENIDGSENSKFPAPEKLLSVPVRLTDLQDNLLVESTPDKAVTGDECDARSNIISGKKRSFTESTLTVQSLNSVESLGVFESRRTTESVPDDNDLLSSILVGRRSSVLKMKPTPPPSQITSMKRPRAAHRVSAYKRKVLMDDTMVLHGDVIRQQLTSTEDIRRIRKKAPCTRPEIWMIQKEFLEDQIFREPIFTGLPTGLALLHSQTYEQIEIRESQNDTHNTFLEAAEDLNLVLRKDDTNPFEVASVTELSMEPNVNEETGKEGINDAMVVGNDMEAEPHENQHGEDPILQTQGYDTQLQMEAISDVLEPQSSPHEHSRERREIDFDGASVSVADAVNPDTVLGADSASSINPVIGDENNIPAGFTGPSAVLDTENGGDGSVEMPPSEVLPDQKLGTQSVEMDASIVSISSGKEVDTMKITEENDDSAVVGGTELRASEEIEDGARTGDTNPFLAIFPETDGSSNQVVATIDHAMEEMRKNEEEFLHEDVLLAAELDYDGKNPTSYASSEEPKVASSFLVELNLDVKNAPSNDENYPGCHETDPLCTMDAEIAAVEHPAVEEHGEFDYTISGHDTGFLNADDDDVVDDEEDDYMPSDEQASFLENSGWSSRTRSVAKYLQVLFDKESEHGRNVLPMDNLLVGKTRKEASRMFFEALVLKTKDYIQVEQRAPFDNIDIKPRMKLMKSDF